MHKSVINSGAGKQRQFTRWGQLLLVLSLALGAPLLSHASDVVTTHKDENGWRLKVNGEDFFVKGMVWGYTPRNENYTYNLWGESDEFIRKVLDYDFGLMKAAGVNAIRSFATIPPKWVTYVYREHGIMTVINPLMGRYGYTIAGKWVPFTNYSDPLTREILLRDTVAIFETYADVPGVLMFALGNESNYGLSWASFEIENLPEGERFTAKARYLYSLYNEIIVAGKKVAPNKPFSIVNGDIQYIDLIAELCPDLDVLGSNVYRGRSFTSLWQEVDEKLDLPVVFYEFGADAFNASEFREDQVNQAHFLRDQWREMYNKAWGNGEEGNAIGAFIFEWRDEWWKYLQVEELDIHNTNASWSNQAYLYDWAEGQNNMNEEWWGITALGTPNADGVYTARPRMAYDVMSQVWSIDPYAWKKSAFNQEIDSIDMNVAQLQGEVRQLKEEVGEKKKILHFTGGTLRAEYLVKGTEQDLDERGENGVIFSDGEMAFLDFAFEPSAKIEGQFTLNLLGNVANKEPLEIAYGRRGLPVVVQTEPAADAEFQFDTTDQLDDRERIEFYDFSATYKADLFDLELFSHVPRYHWGYKGDFFGLMWEATDLGGMDIWNAKAPQGIEIAGKKGWMKGLNVVFGPEVYWGANPKVMLKYTNRFGRFDYTFMHSEDIARRDEATGATGATARQSRATTLSAETQLTSKIKLEFGGIMAATEKVNDSYTRLVSGDIVRDEIDLEDTLGFRAKLSFPVGNAAGYLTANHAGLVADAGLRLREHGTRLPYSGLGAQREYSAGLLWPIGNLWIYPRVLYRDALVDPNPGLESSIDSSAGVIIPGLSPRNREDDPFAILGNRDTRAAELFITYDPTGATPFYQWDNDFREDAKFAFNLGLNYTEYPTATDSYQFFFEPTGANAAFGVGLPKEDVYEASSRMVYNAGTNAKYILNLHAGFQQSTGTPFAGDNTMPDNPQDGTRRFYIARGKAILGKKHIFEGYFKKNAWGPYDFHRQFNITYPEQYKLDYSILLDSKRNEGTSTKVGVKTLFRTFDENSPQGLDEGRDGTNAHTWQTLFYFLYNFGGTPPPMARD
ncbi:MAG: hypothetical protein KJO54_02185 [Gammaproteobacteria bacterium]|nr:hypothetical protein [Gammaproteobacteria bacterium]NNF60683.1 hypothetical protein [Gammaproteobacteria bacterium]NNM19823.1 hypothetical protein [Gammaproteobacteria bacterium]